MKRKQQTPQEEADFETNPSAPRLDAGEATRGAPRPVMPPVRSSDVSAAKSRPRLFSRPRVQILMALVAVVVFLAALVWWLSLWPVHTQVTILMSSPASDNRAIPPIANTSPPLAPPSVIPTATNTPEQATPQPESNQLPTFTPTPTFSPVAPPSSGTLIVPVAGVRPEDLRDTFGDARSEGRTHNALDIMAARGTPVLAAADGRIVKLWLSEPGGITIYQLDQDNKTVYYYAHLDRYADGLIEGHFARQGEVIGYVGDTGNAGAGNYHLHFSVSIVFDPKRYWEGVNINPYPLLQRQ